MRPRGLTKIRFFQKCRSSEFVLGLTSSIRSMGYFTFCVWATFWATLGLLLCPLKNRHNQTNNHYIYHMVPWVCRTCTDAAAHTPRVQDLPQNHFNFFFVLWKSINYIISSSAFFDAHIQFYLLHRLTPPLT